MASQTTLLGAAGEHYVMCELLRRGCIAALAPQGAPNTDIVVTDLSGQKQCAIQVKSRRDKGSDGGWHMSRKHEEIISERLFYCFVDFGKTPNAPPLSYIIPSKIVAETLSTEHLAWLNTPGAKGQKRKDTSMRRLIPDYTKSCKPNPTLHPAGWMEKYKEAWELLGLDT